MRALSSLKLKASVSMERAESVHIWMVEVNGDQPATNPLSDTSLADRDDDHPLPRA